MISFFLWFLVAKKQISYGILNDVYFLFSFFSFKLCFELIEFLFGYPSLEGDFFLSHSRYMSRGMQWSFNLKHAPCHHLWDSILWCRFVDILMENKEAWSKQAMVLSYMDRAQVCSLYFFLETKTKREWPFLASKMTMSLGGSLSSLVSCCRGALSRGGV